MANEIDKMINERGYKSESLQDVMVRYKGFGKDLYTCMDAELPSVMNSIRFFKKTETQPLDSYAVFDNGRSKFALQLDPECEHIIIWNEDKHLEFGFWTTDLYNSVLASIKTEFVNL